jgi:hypothetical protein
MLPAWITTHQVDIFLWVFGPVWVWIAGRIGSQIKAWHASRSEASARMRLDYLKRSLRNPPKLYDSLAFIICFLPFPWAIVALVLTLQLSPVHPIGPPPFDPEIGRKIGHGLEWALSFCSYLILATISYHGFRVAWRMRWGAEHYADTYKKGIEQSIEKLKKKFPRLDAADA